MPKADIVTTPTTVNERLPGLARRSFLAFLAHRPDRRNGNHGRPGGIWRVVPSRDRRSLCRANRSCGTVADPHGTIQSRRGQHAVVGAAWSAISARGWSVER